MALVALVAAAASERADAGSGGVGTTTGCQDSRFGERMLIRGDCGTDVKTLNWILNSKEFGIEAGLGEEFDDATEAAVSSLQEVADLPSSGIVDDETRIALVNSMRKDGASYYGPGMYGNQTACGERLTRTLVGVAHRTLPCGTKVTIKYRGRFLRTTVIDRGPYVDGLKWDLTSAAAKKLDFTFDEVRSAIVRP